MSRRARHRLIVLVIALVAFCPATAASRWQDGGIPICAAGGDQFTPFVVPAGDGGEVIIWADERAGRVDFYAQRIDAVGNPLWQTDGAPVCTTSDLERGDFDVAPDGAGGAFVVWDRILSYADLDQDILIQRITPEGNRRVDAAGVVVCGADGDQYGAALVPDGEGGVVVAWADDRGASTDIYAQRVDSTGVCLWTADGVHVCYAGGDQLVPRLVSDTTGGAIIVWHDMRAAYPDYNVYAQRLDATGAIQWQANGIPLSNVAGIHGWPQITADGSGGAVVVWMDMRLSAAADIFAQAIDGDGQLRWDPAGVPVCTEDSFQQGLRLTTDGAGGGIVTWYDEGSTADVYCQRIDATGTVRWAVDGTPVSCAANQQIAPMIAADGLGGAVITWYDTRSGDVDVYAQHVDDSGSVLWTTDGVPVCTAAGADYDPVIHMRDDGTSIVVWEDGRGADVDIYAAQLDGDGGLVPILLRDFAATPVAGAIELHWTVTTAVAGWDFRVLRADAAGGGHLELGAEIVADGENGYTCRDASGERGRTYRYRVDVLDDAGPWTLVESEPVRMPWFGAALRQNRPNPFNPATVIEYVVPTAGPVRLTVHDLAGRRIATLVDGVLERGTYQTTWRGRDDRGRPVAAGSYHYRLTTGDGTITRAMTLVR